MTARALKLALRVALGLALLAAVVHAVGWQRVGSQLGSASLPWFVAAVLCGIASNAVSAWRWQAIARGLGLAAPLPALLSAYAQGITVNTVLPGATLGGDALRSLRLAAAAAGNDLKRAAASVVLDRASGLWVLCALSLLAAVGLALPGVAHLAPAAPAAALMARHGALVALLLALAAVALLGLALPLAIAPREAGAGEPAAVDLQARTEGLQRLQRLHRLLHAQRGVLLRSVPPSLLVQLLSATTLWLCVQAGGGGIGFAAVLVAAAPVFLAAALPVSVGGFGPREAAAALAFALLGAPAELGIAAALLYGVVAAVQGALAAPLLALPAHAAQGDPRQ